MTEMDPAAVQPVGQVRAQNFDDLQRANEVESQKQDIRLRRMYAKAAIGLVAGQMVVADAVVVIYEFQTDNIDGAVIGGFVAATVVQAIGIVEIVARYLFRPQPAPRRRR